MKRACRELARRIQKALDAGPSELEAAIAPAGKGTDLTANPAPAGTGTEMTAVEAPAPQAHERAVAAPERRGKRPWRKG